jgi:hypothetical protein
MSITADSTVLLAALEPHHLVLQAIGAIGSLIYVGSYLLVQCGHICGNSVFDTICKLVAALCVMVSLATAFNLATFLIQISFITISIFGLWYRMSGRLVARRARQAHIRSMRQDTPAGVDAWMPGESASCASPVQQARLPGRRGYRDLSRWPRHDRGL